MDKLETMKANKFAIYKGREYSADMIDDNQIVLRSMEKRLGFKEKTVKENTIYIKYVEKEEIESFYKLRRIAVYKDFEFEILEEKDNLISIITMTGDYRVWKDLGMQCIDKGVYQKWIPKDEAEIKVVKEDL